MSALPTAGLSRGRELALIAAILVLAGVLRMGWPGLTEFKRDEAALYGLALDLAEFKAFPLRGIGSSVGLPNAPASVYLFALPLFVWKSPLAATLFVGALNTASVGLAYVMARRYWGVRAALIAALFYAAAPWAVLYSRKIWAQNLLPLFVVACIFSALLALVEGRRRWLIAHLALLAVIAQVHLSGLALIPLTALLLIVYRRNVDGRTLGWGALAAAVTIAPFAVYILMQGGRGAEGIGAVLMRPAVVSADSLWLGTLVSLGLEVHSLAGALAFRDFLATVPDFTPVLYLGGALTLGGAVLAVWRWARPGTAQATRNTQYEAGLILVLWLTLPILFFLRHATPVYPHYFILLFPAPYLLAGIALDAAWGRLPRLRAGVAAAAGIVPAAQVWLVAALLGFLGARATPGAFGAPLGLILAVADRVRGAPDVVVVSDGADPHVDERPAVFAALLRGTPHRFVDGRTTAVLPAGDAAVVVWPGAAPYPGEDLIRAWGGGAWAEVAPLRAGEGAVRIARFAGVALGPPQPRAASALLANGVELLGGGGSTATGLWELWWRAPDGDADAEDVTIFAHLLDGAGRRVSQADVRTYPVAGWRAGDLVVSYFPLAGDGAMVRAGLYGAQSLAPVDVLDAAGEPAGPWVEFP